MAILNGKALTEARQKRDWTQVQLSDATKVDVSTISRLERGKPTRVRANTLSKLAKALGVLPGNLCRAAEAERDVMKLRIETAARNALTLVAHRYQISRENIMEIAPLLFFIAAEQSLKERKSRIDDLTASGDALFRLYGGFPYLPLKPPANEDAISSEEQSIKSRDLFGKKMLGRVQQSMWEPSDDFDEAEHNPFVLFLQRSLSNVSTSTELTEPVRWTPGLWPTYHICSEEAAIVCGNDTEAAHAIVCGAAALHEMPKGPPEQRAAWARAEYDRKYGSFTDLLNDITGPQIGDAQAPTSGIAS